MNLGILLPHRIFAEQSAVSRIVVETGNGSLGLLPNRLDCAAALVPGILMYEASSIVTYVAIDEGVLVKAGAEVRISVRRALGGTSLEELQATVRRSFLVMDQRQRDVRVALAKMEAGLMGQFARLQHER
ncbi:MAG: H+-transporting two-sector ATPase, delta/epsilon subunit [Gammaproteobacteria bacterium]|nr:H+-transporting two-sector ATPase, delta/epsilon subunit [Gammaproteobacteria bacterium]